MALAFTCTHRSGQTPLVLGAAEMVVAGWAGRNRVAIEHHIAELAAIGVARPSRVPLFYRVAAHMLSQADSLEVVGPHTSGEVEPLLFVHAGELFISVTSDHTDGPKSSLKCNTPTRGNCTNVSQRSLLSI